MRKFTGWLFGAVAFVIAVVAITISATNALEPNLQMPTMQGGQAAQVLRPSPVTNLVIGYGSTSQTPGEVIRAEVVRIVCSTDCLIEFGTSPTATISSVPLPAATVEYFRVISGVDTIAVIQSASAGTIHMTPMK